ncbi:GGDEF domain-containing protein [Crossiella cryophila]|nr:GGDEF domain-containing protein [Crossiella cryophila]
MAVRTTRTAATLGDRAAAEDRQQHAELPAPRTQHREDQPTAAAGAEQPVGACCRACGQAVGSAGVDFVTRLPDRWGWTIGASQLVAEAAAQGEALVLLVLDLDDFKAVNDVHGHPAGDVVLGAVADVLRGAVGPRDVLARYGGDEFLALCLVADAHEAIRVAHRLGKLVRDLSIVTRGAPPDDFAVRISVTAAVGAAAFRPTRPTRDGRVISLLAAAFRHADSALLEAKGADEDREDRECLVFLGPAGGEFAIV